jgi:hypothetical protein
MDSESCVANRARRTFVPFIRRDAAVRRATFTGGTGTHRGVAEKESWNGLKQCDHMIAAEGIPEGSATRRMMSITLADAGESVSRQDIPLG